MLGMLRPITVLDRICSPSKELIDDTRRPLVQNLNRLSESDRSLGIPNIEHQHCLLDLSGYNESSYLPRLDNDDIRDAVIFQTEVLKRYDSRLLPQYGLLGSICPTKESPVTAITDPRLFLNTNVPFSAFICGLQGSGKSHTISCLLGKYTTISVWRVLLIMI